MNSGPGSYLTFQPYNLTTLQQVNILHTSQPFQQLQAIQLFLLLLYPVHKQKVQV